VAVFVASHPIEADQAATADLGAEPGELRLENDEIGVIVWGPGTTIALSVGKSDIWDRRLPPNEKPVLTLPQMTAMAKDGDPAILNGAAYYTAYNSYDFPCPKPAGQLILQLPFMADGGTVDAVDRDDCVELTFRNDAKSLHVRIFVSAVRNLIVLDCQSSGLVQGDVAVRAYRHRDTIVPGGDLHPTLGGGQSPADFEQMHMPRAGHERDVFWVAQDFHADGTFPDGFTSVLAALVSDRKASLSSSEGKRELGVPMIAPQEGRISHGITKRYTPINEAPGSASTATLAAPESFAVFATVVTTQDDPKPIECAQRVLLDAARQGVAPLWEEHQAKLTGYRDQPRARVWSSDGSLSIDVPWGGVPYRVRSAGYHGDVPLCSVGSTKFCYQDSSPWHADFHFNELGATETCMRRQFDLLESYFATIQNLLPMAQANAREVYDSPGAMYPLIHYPLKADSVIHSHLTWEQSMEITALIMKPLWERFLYTWDDDFLRERANPVMREGARFYADYLTEDEDGSFHVFPTVSPEHRGITKDFAFNRNSQSGITLVRYHLRASAQAADLLAQDPEEAARWTHIAEHMPDYPLVDTPNGPIFIDVAGAEPIEYNIPVPLSAVFWGDDISLDSPLETLKMARSTLEQINVWEPHRFYLAKVRRRLGIWNPGDGLGLENVLQSHTGVLRVFPCVPDEFQGGFENLGAQGAFVVASNRDETGVEWIEVLSLAGNPCLLAPPWPAGETTIADKESGELIRMQAIERNLRFETATGCTYRITPKKSAEPD
jgi:hypothetical protein